MRSSNFRRPYKSGMNENRLSSRKELRIYGKFKKHYYPYIKIRFNTFRKRKFHKNKRYNKNFSIEKLDKELDKYFKNNKDHIEKNSDVEMKDDAKPDESNKNE